MTSVLEVRNLSVTAGRAVLVKDVSFAIEQGEILALVGESGSGKTLTALSLMRLLPEALRQSGEVTPSLIRGLDAGMIFQEPMSSLNPLHTIGRQIAEAIHVHHRRLPERELVARVQALMDKVGLAHFKTRLGAYPHQLSGGERQRVMIAMAIANEPKLLIADEPTTALDVTIQAQILDLMQELRKRLKMAVLLITHDLALVRRVADRVAIMSKGELVEMGKTEEIFTHPKHPYTKHLLASEPGEPPKPVQSSKVLMECKGLKVAYTTSAGILSFKKHRHEILHDINLSVAKGTTLGVVGESGSGKTTLALALLRLAPSSGEIDFYPDEVVRLDKLTGRNLRAARRDMQIVFQDPFSSLNPRMTIGEIVREGLDIHEPGLLRREREDRLDVILKEVGLEPSAKERYPHEFSGGQRQRISIARALILKPKLLILDEPTSALDRSVQAQMLDMLKKLQEKYGMAYIFISHDLRVIRAISHRIVVLQKGQVVEAGEAREIFEQPKQAYTQALLKAAMF